MSQRILCVLSLVALLLPVQYAGAYEVLTARELASHCVAISKASDSTDGQYCIRYIQGFIDGAAATDARVMVNLESELANETFSERAIRLRAPDLWTIGTLCRILSGASGATARSGRQCSKRPF